MKWFSFIPRVIVLWVFALIFVVALIISLEDGLGVWTREGRREFSREWLDIWQWAISGERSSELTQLEECTGILLAALAALAMFSCLAAVMIFAAGA